jgi:hypothetical protein
MLIAVLKLLPTATLRQIPSTPPWRFCDFVGKIPVECVGRVAELYLESSGVMALMRTRNLYGKFTEFLFDKLSHDGEDLMATGKYLRALDMAKRILYSRKRASRAQQNTPDPDTPLVIDLPDSPPKKKCCAKYPSKNPHVKRLLDKSNK